VQLARAAVSALPEGAAQAVGRGLGGAAFVLGVRRTVARENVARAFGELDAAAREELARRAYAYTGTSFVEFLRLPRMSAADLRARAVLEGEAHLRSGLAAGRGVVAASGHLGNWEMIGASIAARGFPVTFVVQRLRNRRVDAIVNGIRRAAGIEVVERGMALRGVHRALAANRIVFFMCDQDARRRGVFVPFFGVPASTPTGAAQLALRLGAAFVPAFSWRRDDGVHVALFTPAVGAAGAADEDAAVLQLLGEFNRRLEAAIRKAPAQYWWAHRRWKTRPPHGG
jgi:KDO2-lipid IV(A) lauroyltransferase